MKTEEINEKKMVEVSYEQTIKPVQATVEIEYKEIPTPKKEPLEIEVEVTEHVKSAKINTMKEITINLSDKSVELLKNLTEWLKIDEEKIINMLIEKTGDQYVADMFPNWFEIETLVREEFGENGVKRLYEIGKIVQYHALKKENLLFSVLLDKMDFDTEEELNIATDIIIKYFEWCDCEDPDDAYITSDAIRWYEFAENKPL